VSARDDWELWTELKWKRKLSSSQSIFGGGYTRFRRNFGEFYKQSGYLGFSQKILPWLKGEPVYLFEFSERPRVHDEVHEHRIFLNLIPFAHLGRFSVENRHRMEFRHINGSDDWRYRTRAKVSLPLFKESRWEIIPFIWDEVFYGFRAGELGRNRFSLGTEKPLTKTLSLELYYLVESNKTGSDWAEFHAVGSSLSFSF